MAMQERICHFLCSLLLLSLLPFCLLAGEARELPRLTQAVDVYDNIILGIPDEYGYYTKELLHKRMELAAAAGIKKVYFRGTGGVTYFPSKVRKRWNGAHWWYCARGVKALDEYDILAEFIKAAHELGMELYYWEPVFDTSGWLHYYPGTPECEKYGEYPSRDTNIATDKFVAHRYYDRPVENLKGPIRELLLHLHSVPGGVTSETLAIYTAPHGQDFRRYEKPYQVEVVPDKEDAKRSYLRISGLEVADPCIKLMNVGKPWSPLCLSEPKQADCATATYVDGSPVDLFCACEYIWDGDTDPARNRRGPSGTGTYWGIMPRNSEVLNRTFIIRFGDFDHYAAGVPEYAYKENRDRINAIVTELYENYPELDGVTFSIRTHSLPSGGNFAECGDCGDMYGFSKPVVDEYRRRYGVDIQKEKFDEQKFLKLRGEFFTQMLAEASAIVHAHGGKLECMAPLRPGAVRKFNLGAMYPWWNRMSWRDFFAVREWAQKGIVDNVLLLGTGHQQDTWDTDWKQELKAVSRELEGTSTKLSLHYLINGARESDVRTVLPEVLLQPELAEVEFYEEFHMWAFNHYPWVTDCVAAAKARLAQPAGRAYPAPSFEEEFEGVYGAAATEGYDGKGLLLGGEGNATRAFSQPNLFSPQGGTVCFWMKPVNWSCADYLKPLCLFSADEGRSRLIVNKYAGNEGKSFWNNKICFLYGKSKDDAGAPGFKMVATAGNLCRQGEWIHVTAAWTPERLKIYYNGRLQAENRIVQPIDAMGTFTLGDASATGTLTAFDKVQVFGRELTAEEVAAVAAE